MALERAHVKDDRSLSPTIAPVLDDGANSRFDYFQASARARARAFAEQAKVPPMTCTWRGRHRLAGTGAYADNELLFINIV